MFDVTFPEAFVAGLWSFVSPCVLPLVPFYLCFLIGVGVEDRPRRSRLLGIGLSFALGFAAVFVLLGAGESALGQLLSAHFEVLRWVAVALIAGCGVLFLIGRSVPLGVAFGVGLAFAFGWTPCVGPVLSVILFLAAQPDTATQGTRLLIAYGTGLAVPFVAIAGGAMVVLRPSLSGVRPVLGVAMAGFAGLIASDRVSVMAQWLLEHVAWFSSVG